MMELVVAICSRTGWVRYAARENGEEQDLRVRKIVAQFEDDRADTFGDFGRARSARIVRADHQHDGFGLKTWPSPFFSPHNTSVCRRHPEIGRAYWPKYLPNTALLRSP